MLQNKYDVVVVGGGPAGSMASWEAAKGGASVCMLEKDRDIGYPVRCGEAAGESGLKQFVEIQDSWVAEKITSAKLVSPNCTSVNIDFASETGFILNRRIFDYDLSRYAANAGAEVYTKAYVKDMLKENGQVTGVVLDYLGTEQIKMLHRSKLMAEPLWVFFQIQPGRYCLLIQHPLSYQGGLLAKQQMKNKANMEAYI